MTNTPNTVLPSGLCIGLDPDVEKFPAAIRNGSKPLETFLSAIVLATRPFASAFKINTAFFEQYGRSGIDALYAVREAVGNTFCIIDAKRGDIGNTSAAYAKSLFEDLNADAATVAPYMGSDSVEPFLEYANKLVYVLALTSNPGSADFQRKVVESMPLYRHVMDAALTWKRSSQIGFVVGATHAEELMQLRSVFPQVPFLIPGIGTQGGDKNAILSANQNGPALFNMSRAILYASNGDDFAEAAALVASKF